MKLFLLIDQKIYLAKLKKEAVRGIAGEKLKNEIFE